jgi:thiol:disulfide interchange protein DsbA
MNLITRRFLAGAAAALCLALPLGAHALTEGQDYKLLKPAQSTSAPAGKVEVVEVFWYACGHCYTLEPSLESWARKGKPDYVEFVRVPAVWNDIVKLHARAFYTAEALGKLDVLHPEIFREINVRGNRLDTPAKLEAFFVSKGVAKADFQKAFNSFAVEQKLLKAVDINRRYRISSTPTLVVGGRYVTDVAMAGSDQRLFEVVNELADKARGGTPAR